MQETVSYVKKETIRFILRPFDFFLEAAGIDATFKVASGKTGEQNLARLGLPITISVKKNNVRRAGHDDAAARGDEPIHRRQIRGPHLSGIIRPSRLVSRSNFTAPNMLAFAAR